MFVYFCLQDPVIVLATAHIGKFTDQVQSKLGPNDTDFEMALRKSIPAQLSSLYNMRERKTIVSASSSAVLHHMRAYVGTKSLMNNVMFMVVAVMLVTVCASYLARSS